MKLTCAIIDDEPLAVELLESYVRKTPFLELKGAYNGGITALEALKTEPVDLLFCDIQMPELSGMELSRMLPTRTRGGFPAVDARRRHIRQEVCEHAGLCLNDRYADFLTAANKAFEWFELKRRSVGKPSPAEAGPGSIFVKTEYRLRQIELDKILYIEGLKDYVKIYVEDEPRPVLSLISLKTLEEQLPAERFVRVHRSYIVQPSKIRIIERGRIVFGKTYIPVSDGYKEAFYAFLEARSLMPKSDK